MGPLPSPDDAPDPAPDDAQAHSLIATLLHRSGRPDAALAEYDRALDADPEHLPARFDRALLLYSLRRNEGANEMAALIDHARFEELLRADARAIRAYHYLAAARLRSRLPTEAVRAAEAGAARARLILKPNSPLVADSDYVLSRSLAASASYGGPEGLIECAAESFGHASRAEPGRFDHHFANDPAFDGARERITALLGLRPGSAP